jgi:hypothetical protein
MSTEHEIIVITVSRDEDGLYTATSADLKGVFVAHRDLQKIVEDMPNIIRLWFKRNRDAAVEVFQAQVRQVDDEYAIQAMTIPAEIAAAALTR